MKQIEQIIDVLPQTQCRLCTYQDCKAYATAINSGDRIDRCVPGGIETLEKIASIMQVNPSPFEKTFKKTSPTATTVVIEEPECIGCTKCIKACPVDAIVGTHGMMHTVIAKECTGCNLCISACPVDCISSSEQPVQYNPHKAKERYDAKQLRTQAPNINPSISNHDPQNLKLKQDYISKLKLKQQYK